MFFAAASSPDEKHEERQFNESPILSERALILSRVLERQTRKHTVTKRVSIVMPQPIRIPPKDGNKTIHEIPSNLFKPMHSTPFDVSRNSPTQGDFIQCYFSRVKGLLLRIRESIWLLLHDATSSYEARCVSIFILFTVAVSIIVYIVQTQPDLDNQTRDVMVTIEHICIYIFSGDILARLLCCPSLKYFILDPFNWIDFVSVLPYYLELFVDSKQKAGTSLSAIRTMRLLRVARILKLSRYTSSLQIFVKALSLSAKPLFMLVFLMGITLIIFSSAIYFAEMTESPSLCRNPIYSKTCHPNLNPADDCCEINPFNSIPAAFWWCIVTMTTVGYGDTVPVTPAGKLIAAITMVAGMIILALPISVIGSNFQRVMKDFAHDVLKKNIEVVANMDIIRRAEMIEVLRSFEIIGDNIDIDPDELIALYDLNQSGTLEDDELTHFRNDLADLQNIIRNHQVQIVSPERELRVKQLSFGGSFNKRMSSEGPTARQLQMIEQMIETRLLESEVRMEAKISLLTKALMHLQSQLELMGD